MDDDLLGQAALLAAAALLDASREASDEKVSIALLAEASRLVSVAEQAFAAAGEMPAPAVH